MEEGEEIIKNILKTSGMIIPEFFNLAQKAFSKADPRDMNFSKKEISDYLAEKRRLNQYYREPLKAIFPSLKNYMDMKEKIASTDGDIISDKKLAVKRTDLLEAIIKIDIHQEEIFYLSEKFINASRKIKAVPPEAGQNRKNPQGQQYERGSKPGTWSGFPCEKAGD